MSQRNGDRARFHKDRKRKLRHRQRIAALTAQLRRQAVPIASERTTRIRASEPSGHQADGLPRAPEGDVRSRIG